MGITVEEAFQLPVMTQTKLLAGSGGLGHVIKWVTIVEVIDDSNRLQDGEFLITTGFGLADNEEKQKQFQALLSHKKLSGVAIYTDFYLKKIPESFIRAAEEANLPLIEIPTHINFSMITKEILEQIVNKQKQMFEYSLSIHQELTKLVLGNHGIEPITRTLSRLIQGSIMVFNHLSEIADYHIVNQQFWISERGLPMWGDQELILPTLITSMNQVDTNDHRGIVIYPIIANETHYGFILAIKDEDEPWREIDQIAVEHAATVYAIEFLKQKAVEDTEVRLQGDFLDEILSQSFKNQEFAIQRGKKLGFDLTLNQAVLHLKIDQIHLGDTRFNEIMDHLYYTVHQVLRSKHRQYILRNKLDGLIILTEVDALEGKTSKVTTLELANQLEAAWNSTFPSYKVHIGIGRNYKETHLLAQSAREAHFAVTFSSLLHKPRSIVHYEDLGLYHLLVHMQDMGVDMKDFFESHIGSLLRLSRQGKELVHTLESYLYNNQSIHHTATELFIHRHTLKYRLNQIEKRTGYDLESSDDRMKLQLAIMAYKLYQTPEGGSLAKNTLII